LKRAKGGLVDLRVEKGQIELWRRRFAQAVVLRVFHNTGNHKLLRMVMIVPDPLAERVCVTEILARECLVDNAGDLWAAFILGRELPAQEDRLPNGSEVARGHEIAPDVVLRSCFGSG